MRLLIDDLRDFLSGDSPSEVARTSSSGIALLLLYRSSPIDELWLDHDLGGDDTIWPVVEELERAAFSGTPYDIATIYVHSANPPGAAAILQALRRWDYHVRLATSSPLVGYRGA